MFSVLLRGKGVVKTSMQAIALKPKNYGMTEMERLHIIKMEERKRDYSDREMPPHKRLIGGITSLLQIKMAKLAESYLEYEAKEMMRRAKVGKTQFGVNTTISQTGKARFNNRSVEHLIKLAERHGGIVIGKAPLKKGLDELKFSFPNEGSLQDFMAYKDNMPPFDADAIMSTRSGMYFLNHQEAAKKSLWKYMPFATAPVEDGGMGFPEKWLLYGGDLDLEMEKNNYGSTDIAEEIEANKGFVEQIEKLERRLGIKDGRVADLEEKLKAAQKKTNSLLLGFKETGKKMTPEIQAILAQIKEIEKALTV